MLKGIELDFWIKVAHKNMAQVLPNISFPTVSIITIANPKLTTGNVKVTAIL